LGGTFTQSAQGGTSSSFNASARNDLSFAIFGPDGTTQLAVANTASIGFMESVVDLVLTAPGNYYIRVAGAADAVQLYELQLSATALIAQPTGDFNSDGIVDAADYVLWRKMNNQTGSALLADGDGDDTVGLDDYHLWRTRFGETAETTSSGDSRGVPEPDSIAMLILFVTALGATRNMIRLRFSLA
jgi:hypothetical protein